MVTNNFMYTEVMTYLVLSHHCADHENFLRVAGGGWVSNTYAISDIFPSKIEPHLYLTLA